MDCLKVQEEIGAGRPVDPEIRRHVEDCAECRSFAADLHNMRLLAEIQVETPVLLREQTLDACRAILTEEAAVRRMPTRQRLRRMVESPRFAAAAASLSVIIMVALFAGQIGGGGDGGANLFMRLAFGQIAVQNLATALFLPALLTFRNGIRLRRINPKELGE